MSETNGKRGIPIDSPYSYEKRTTSWGETGKEVDIRLKRERRRPEYIAQCEAMCHRDGVNMDYARMAVAEEFPPLSDEEMRTLQARPSDGDFLQQCRDALDSMTSLKATTSVEIELEWVQANVYRSHPLLNRVPSRMAVAWLIAMKRDQMNLATKAELRLWDVYLTKRMSPGDRKKSKADKAFQDKDHAEMAQDQSASDHEEMMQRIWPKGAPPSPDSSS